MATGLDDFLDSNERSLYHVVVVGFHHKKGCIVEYAYPPFIEGQSHDSPLLPEEWKHLPFLALPDGAHNYNDDTIYFHLPPKKGSSCGTVYCVSCYRQIDSSLLKKKDEDVTRGTVQKSVVVLSKMPIYGLLHAKLQLITHAYFEEKDFSQKHILKELYDHINVSVSRVDESQRFLGLSARNLVVNFNHKIVILFKLILLERRVIFHASPVHKLVGSIMSLLSLFPRMIEAGLVECTNLPESKRMDLSSASQHVTQQTKIDGNDNSKEPVKHQHEVKTGSNTDTSIKEGHPGGGDGSITDLLKTDTEQIINPTRVWQATTNKAKNVASSISARIGSLTASAVPDISIIEQNRFGLNIEEDPESDIAENDEFVLELENARLEMTLDSPEKLKDMTSPPVYGTSIHGEILASSTTNSYTIYDNEELEFNTTLDTDEFGFPLSIFTKGHLCLPYVCLQQYDILAGNIKHGFITGATNILFKTHQNLSDVVIDVDSCEFIYHDSELRNLLHLSTADLRFADHLVSNVVEKANQDVFLDATGWEGGDEWIQTLFMEYLHGMLAISVKVCPDPKDIHDYNEFFLAAWKQTKNYRIWKQGNYKLITDMEFAHPFHAQYSVSDMKLRLHHNLQSSERGRKFEGAITNANQAMANTGKFVGSAIVSAKSSLSSWFSSKLSSS